MLEINFGAVSATLNIEPIIPATNFTINSPPALSILGKLFANAFTNLSIISGAFSINLGKASIIPVYNS